VHRPDHPGLVDHEVATVVLAGLDEDDAGARCGEPAGDGATGAAAADDDVVRFGGDLLLGHG
jgi:hypothetical protein